MLGVLWRPGKSVKYLIPVVVVLFKYLLKISCIRSPKSRQQIVTEIVFKITESLLRLVAGLHFTLERYSGYLKSNNFITFKTGEHNTFVNI